MNIGWYVICLVIGLALDWAFVDRIALSIEVLLKREQQSGYSTSLFPRIVITLIGLILVARGSEISSPPEAIFYAGVLLFIASLAWGIARVFRSSSRTGE
jgi:hypothetical protein